jgi:hypothetical protein
MGEDLWQTPAKLVHMGSLATLEESKEEKGIAFFFLHNKIDVLIVFGWYHILKQASRGFNLCISILEGSATSWG